MSMPQISVIVPVYQAEKWLRRCLDSIVNQTFLDWECILVDDGSKDRSGAICDEYASRDSRFRVIHQANQGVSVARQVGLDAAKGVYVIHADSDDWVEPDWLEKLHQKITADNVDMVICDYEQIYVDRIKYVSGCVTSVDNTDLLMSLVRYWGGCLWNKLIRRECFIRHHVTFHPEMWGFEDTYVITKLLTNPIKVSHLPEALCHYDIVMNKSSLTKLISDKHVRSLMLYINTFSPILTDSRFDEGWYFRKKSVKMLMMRMEGNCRWSIKDVYPEINERLIEECRRARWWSRMRCVALCLQGHQKTGRFLYRILTKLIDCFKAPGTVVL